MSDSILNQSHNIKCAGRKVIDYCGEKAEFTVQIRYDDSRKNGHNTFCITGTIRNPREKGDAAFLAGGCLHDEIKQHFPELAYLIPWHLCSTDGPMHYIANTVYHASNRDHNGLLEGEESTNPRLMKHHVTFGDSSIVHKVSRRLKEFIDTALRDGTEFIVQSVHHDPDKGKTTSSFKPKYEFAGMACKWHECPFNSPDEANQWLAAITSCRMNWTSRTNVFGEGKARDLDAARHAAIWPDATDDQLCSPRHVLESLLTGRLPGLLAEFRKVIEGLGFTY